MMASVSSDSEGVILIDYHEKIKENYQCTIQCFRIQTPSSKTHRMSVLQDNSPDNSAQVSVTEEDNCDFYVQHRASSFLKRLAPLNVIFSRLKFHQMVANLKL